MPNPKPPASGGGIVRRAHDRENPYVMISRALADDTTLSLEARGLMLYLLSKPPDWQVQMRDLQRTAGCARDKMQRIMRELETARYVVRECHHDERGHWIWESTVYEVPQIEPLQENPVTVQPVTVPPSPDKAVIQERESGLTKDEQIKENTAAPPNKNGSIPPPYSGILVLAAQDHAQAFNLRGDVIGRVLRAWAANGQPDQTFLEEVLSPAGHAARKARGDKAGAYWRVVEGQG